MMTVEPGKQPILLITNGEVYTPVFTGRRDILIVHGTILRIGSIPRASLDAEVFEDVEVIDAAGCMVTPGLIDPHEHIDGGSGESGFATRTPPLSAAEIAGAGITTAVGVLGTDVTTKSMASLLARARALEEHGLSICLLTGGYAVPPATLTGSVREDILFIPEILGAGEVAVSDHRSSVPSTHELAHVVHEAHIGGMLSGKCGVTHFHIGEARSMLAPLHALLDHSEYAIEPAWLYPTHVERYNRLVEEAAMLSQRGCTVDMDTVMEDLTVWLPVYLNAGGDPQRLTVSSDAAITSPLNLFDQVRRCVCEIHIPLERMLHFATLNTASVLRLPQKGRLQEGADGDVLILTKDALEIRDVVARGVTLVRDGIVKVKEASMAESNRLVELRGAKRVEKAGDR